jgi:hypothetical protein
MIRDGKFKQRIRHESLSLVMANKLEIWMFSLWSNKPAWFKKATLYSSSGHHLKFPGPFAGEQPGLKVRIFYDHLDLRAVMDLGAKLFGIDSYPMTTSRGLNGDNHSTV